MSPEDSIRKFLSTLSERIRTEQIKLGLIASGRSADSLQIKSTENSGQLLGDDSFHYQQDEVGRKPGKMPPIKSIQQWIKDKGLELNAWAVAKSIMKKGTTLFRRTRRGLTIDLYIEELTPEFLEDLAAAYLEEVEARIDRALI